MFRKLKNVLVIATLFVATLNVDIGLNVQADTSGFEHPEFIELLDQIIESETKYGLSGVQLAVYKDGKLVKNSAYGYTNNFYNTYDDEGNVILDEIKALPIGERNQVTTNTLFDMASNTKMYATVFAMQKLVSDGDVTLDTLIKDIFPVFVDHGNENGWKDIITVQHVLSHYAGFAPDPQYHNDNYDLDDGIPNGKNDLFSQEKSLTFDMIMKTPVTTEPGTSWNYSDVDMMLAGFIVEHITGKDLDTYVKEVFYEPLGLDRITFNPLRFGFLPNDTSSAEVHGNTRDGRIDFVNVRHEIVTGEVHDEKAFYAMDGVSGHAGLFGTAQQVAYLAQTMFNGTLNGIEFFDQDTIDEFTTPANLLTQTNGGWRRKSETGGAASWYSVFAPAGVIGHTGWTGTNTFIDSNNNITLALFTNRTNSPLLGADNNTFYTTNSNVSSYGAVSEFIYRALGLADGKSVTATFENMINAEIPANLATATSAKRNVVRSLLDVLVLRSETDPEAKSFLETDHIQDTIKTLETTYSFDTKFLVATKSLDVLIEEAQAVNKSLYTENSYEDLLDAINDSIALLAENYLQEEIDTQAGVLASVIDNLQLKVDKSQLGALIDEIESTDSELYTEDSYTNLVEALNVAMEFYEKSDVTQAEIDEAYVTLEEAYEGLVFISEVEVPPTDETEIPSTDDELPTTGYSNIEIIGSSMILIFFGIVTVLISKRKNRIV